MLELPNVKQAVAATVRTDMNSTPRRGRAVSGRSPREDVGAADAVLARDVLLRGPGEAVVAPHDAHVGEAGLSQRRDELCLRQSAADSSGP